jgi:hypothetical protein
VASYLISTAVTVKEDYDKVETFFDKMEEFMTRLSILKNDLPKEAVLQDHLVKILEAFLTLCGISSKYVEAKHFSMASSPCKGCVNDSLHRAFPFKHVPRRWR